MINFLGISRSEKVEKHCFKVIIILFKAPHIWHGVCSHFSGEIYGTSKLRSGYSGFYLGC